MHTLINTDVDLWDEIGPLFENISQYRRLIGKLIYGIVTKPDIAYARISESIYAQAKDFDRDPTRTDIFFTEDARLESKDVDFFICFRICFIVF